MAICQKTHRKPPILDRLKALNNPHFLALSFTVSTDCIQYTSPIHTISPNHHFLAFFPHSTQKGPTNQATTLTNWAEEDGVEPTSYASGLVISL